MARAGVRFLFAARLGRAGVFEEGHDPGGSFRECLYRLG
jgi:hypothetical protein